MSFSSARSMYRKHPAYWCDYCRDFCGYTSDEHLNLSAVCPGNMGRSSLGKLAKMVDLDSMPACFGRSESSPVPTAEEMAAGRARSAALRLAEFEMYRQRRIERASGRRIVTYIGTPIDKEDGQ